jgi:trehalose 6-phosphate synthase
VTTTEARSGDQPGASVLIASNRGPVSFKLAGDGSLTAAKGSGGLVSGLSAAARSGELTDTVWVAAALSEADRQAVAQAPGGRLDHLDGIDVGTGVRMLDIDEHTYDLAYNQVSNRTLWFCNHVMFGMPEDPVFGEQFFYQWEAYRRYNQAFAAALAEEAAPGARVLVQDYHLFLVPGMLREARPDLRIGHFTHTPWAPPETFRWLPDHAAREIVLGMLGSDQAGFHTRAWADEFGRCCTAVLGPGATYDGSAVTWEGRRTRVEVFPLGVDGDDLQLVADQPGAHVWRDRLIKERAGRRMILRVDRSEPSKNIVRGLLAYAELLRHRPEWRDHVVLHAYCNPSRGDLDEYQDYSIAFHEVTEQINAEFGTLDWTPVILKVDDDFPRSLAAMQIADVIVTNPVRDGMNLVAKEAAILSHDGIGLVLSREAGAFDELRHAAYVVNPFDISQTADAIHDALSATPGERRERTDRLVEAATRWPPGLWLTIQLTALS